jgi:hypothetical protein
MLPRDVIWEQAVADDSLMETWLLSLGVAGR